MDVLFERVAGLDVGKASVTVCVRTPGPGGKRVSETRTFKTMTRSLAVMADWLEECGVTLAAMESTATYWKPVFYCLEERMECWLLNAAHMKAVPGRKTDVKDAEWIAQLLEHGLLRSSFVPPPEIRQLRNLTRYRLQVMGDRTRDAGRLEKLLEDASIKLSVVASNITGTSARDMLGALVAGERDPAVMADFARNRMRRKLPDLAEALTGRFDEHHALLVGSLLRRLEHTEATLRELDAEIVARMAPWDHQLELLRTIPGVGVITSQVFIAETGGDMSRFGSAEQLAAWAGVAPAAHESAGKRTPAGLRGRATSSSPRCSSRPRTPRPGPRTPTCPCSSSGSLPGGVTAARRSRSRTPCSCRPTGCSSGTSPTRTSDRTGWPSATTRRTHGAWSPSSNASATPSSSTPSPDTYDRRNPLRASSSGLRPDAVAPSCSSFSGQSALAILRLSRVS